MPFPLTVVARLTSIYEELMWLAHRPEVTSMQARAWYSQVLAHPMAKHVRRFTGMVSQEAIENIQGRLVLEHQGRLSYELSKLIAKHFVQKINDPSEFIALIAQCEQVNITTDEENHRAQKAKGVYAAASIHLVEWNRLSIEHREFLWKSKLRGKVSNADAYAPHTEPNHAINAVA